MPPWEQENLLSQNDHYLPKLAGMPPQGPRLHHRLCQMMLKFLTAIDPWYLVLAAGLTPQLKLQTEKRKLVRKNGREARSFSVGQPIQSGAPILGHNVLNLLWSSW